MYFILCFEFGVQGLGFRVWDEGFGFRVQVLGFRFWLWGLGCGPRVLEFRGNNYWWRVKGLGLRV